MPPDPLHYVGADAPFGHPVQRMLGSVAEHLLDPLLLLDPAGQVLYANPAFRRRFPAETPSEDKKDGASRRRWSGRKESCDDFVKF